MNSVNTSTLDIGCGLNPKNPFNAEQIYGIDIRESDNPNIKKADLNVEAIPFNDKTFDYVTAFDFIEHIPRILYMPNRRFPFVELMNEVYRVLKPNGIFFSFTPAFPMAPAWRDPTHVNIITDETFTMYFCKPELGAKMYGFSGNFSLVKQEMHPNNIHLMTTLRKL